MRTTEKLLARHEAALKSALSEAKRLRDGLILILTGLGEAPALKAADLDEALDSVLRLKGLQAVAIREDTAIRQLTARATHAAG